MMECLEIQDMEAIMLIISLEGVKTILMSLRIKILVTKLDSPK